MNFFFGTKEAILQILLSKILQTWSFESDVNDLVKASQNSTSYPTVNYLWFLNLYLRDCFRAYLTFCNALERDLWWGCR